MNHSRKQAIELFGKEKVAAVEALVFIADPDMVYSTLQDQGDDDGAEIVEMLYFNKEAA